MIKIEVEKIDEVKDAYFEGVKNMILTRIEFYLLVFKIIDRQAGFDVQSLRDYEGYETRTKTAKIKVFGATANTFSTQNDYDKLLIAAEIAGDLYNNRAAYITLLNTLSNENELKKLILAEPINLITANNIYNGGFVSAKAKELFKEIVPYEKFKDRKTKPYNGYDLSAALKVNVCPYCNRNFTATIIGKNKNLIYRPAFDHFFSQGDYPILALSFYNLIPCCDPCNSAALKGQIEFTEINHMHPYVEGFVNKARFDYLQVAFYPDKTDARNYKIILNDHSGFDIARKMKIFGDVDTNPEWGNVEVFKIREVYQAHTDVIGELIVKADKDSPYHATSLFKSLPQFKSNKKEFYRFYFSNYFDESDFNRRPLAKLTRDFVNKYLPEFNV